MASEIAECVIAANGAPGLASSNQGKHTKSVIVDLLKKNSERVKLQDRITKRSSSVWRRFKLVIVDDTQTDLVRCNECTTLLTFKVAQGTSALIKHQCTKNTGARTTVPASQRTIDSFMSKAKVPATVKDTLNKDIVLGLARDLRPLYSAAGPGFLKIAQSLINLGAVYGKQDAAEVIAHRTTLQKKYLPELVDKLRSDMTTKLTPALAAERFAFTFDLWTDKYQQRSYLSVTVHFIDEDFKLQKYLLEVAEYDEEDKTTANIGVACRKIIEQYFPEAKKIMEKSYAVTDGGTNVMKIFDHRLPCYCHRVNTLLKWTFMDEKIPAPEEIEEAIICAKPLPRKKLFKLSIRCPIIRGVLSAVKDVVTYFKRAGLNKDLTKSLKQEVPTRWSSKLSMLESYLDSSDEVRRILLEHKKFSLLSSLNDDVIKSLVEFLRPFKECIDLFQKEKEPAIHKVVPQLWKLRKHLAIRENDSDEMKALREQASACYEEYCGVDLVYYLAFMLHPR